MLAYEPPRRLVLGYGICADARPAPPEAASELELILIAADGGKTELQLEHRQFERQGEQAALIRESMASPRGWPLILAELRRGLARTAAADGGATWNVLLALDDSPASEAALESALARPWPAGAAIRVLAVAPAVLGAPVAGPPIGALETSIPQLADMRVQAAALELGDRIAQRACERLSAAGLSAQSCTRTGSAGHEIVEEARSWPADLVLLGSKAHTGLARLLLGSTAEYVMHHAPCSVEVARLSSRG